MRRLGFTMIELIFVILIMGILAKFGIEFLAQAYNNFIFSSINNSLQARGEAAVETIASRLQYRVKDSIIAKKTNGDFQALAGTTYGETATILEWVGTDIENLRGNSAPNWSGIIDIDASTATVLKTPGTDTSAINNMISVLSHGSGTTIDNAAIYYIGSDSDINGYGWNGTLTDHNTSVMHRIADTGNVDEFQSAIGGVDFSGSDVYEYYQLAWTAYAVVHSPDGNLTLYYDYQPWEGDSYANGKSDVIMENVDTFRFKAIGSVVKIQVCVNTDIVEDYSLCKEKTIY